MPFNKLSVSSLDHLVITTNNIGQTIEFYTQVLGMEKEIFGQENRVAMKFGKQKINLHPYGHEFHPHAYTTLPGSQDLCFISNIPISEWEKSLKSKQIKIELGPVKRSGARGPIDSIYFSLFLYFS